MSEFLFRLGWTVMAFGAVEGLITGMLGVLLLMQSAIIGVVSFRQLRNIHRDIQKNRRENRRLCALTSAELMDEEGKSESNDENPVRHASLARYFRFAGRLAEIDGLPERACIVRDREFLDALKMLRRVITRERAWGRKDDWNAEGVKVFFSVDATLSDRTLRIMLKSVATRFPKQFAAVIDHMPDDVASLLLDARSDATASSAEGPLN